jgi:hypothetical protein
MESGSVFIKGEHGLLKTAIKKLRNLGYVCLHALGDDMGVFSIEYPKFFLNAKEYFYHNTIVSIQGGIVDRAKILNKDLVIYVAKVDCFYIFYPQDIIDNHWENTRIEFKYIRGELVECSIIWYNWDVSLGKVLQT